MNWICGFCSKEYKRDYLIAIADLKYQKINFLDIINDLFETSSTINFGCSPCIESIKTQYDFKQNVMKHQRILTEDSFSCKIMKEVQKHLKPIDEETLVITYNQMIMIVPESKKDIVAKLKFLESAYEPKVSLKSLNIEIEDWSDTDDDEDFERIAIKMEPNIELNHNEDISAEPTASKCYLEDLSVEERGFVRKNIHTSRNRKFFKCKICNKKYRTRTKVTTHIKRDHLMKIGSKLQKWISQKIKQGMIKTEGEKKYKCVICENRDKTVIAFKRAAHLRYHLNDHKKVDNFRNALEEEMEVEDDDGGSQFFDHPFAHINV